MKKRRIFLITVMLLVGNTSNIYADSFIQEESEISLSDIEDAGAYTENLAYVFWDNLKLRPPSAFSFHDKWFKFQLCNKASRLVLRL